MRPFPGPDPVGADLLRRWSEPHRRYHDLRHLDEVLAALPADAPPVVVLAAWFHDAVYDPTADGNEAASAQLARQRLTGVLPAADVDEVARLVLLTATHDPGADDGTGAQLCDADLAVLASPRERYDRYAADVRAEYAHLDGAAFRRGREAVLRTLLSRARLFTAPGARERWEDRARANLSRELRTLVGPSDGADRSG